MAQQRSPQEIVDLWNQWANAATSAPQKQKALDDLASVINDHFFDPAWLQNHQNDLYRIYDLFVDEPELGKKVFNHWASSWSGRQAQPARVPGGSSCCSSSSSSAK